MASVFNPEQDKNCCWAANSSFLQTQGHAALPTLTISGKIRATATFFFLLVSAILNTSFLLKLRRRMGQEQSKRSSRMKTLLKHLMLANLLETLVIMPLDGIWNLTVQWYAGELLCKVLSFLKLFSMYAPAFMVVVISLDRCLAITRPLMAKSNSRIGRNMLGLAWGLSVLLAGPQLFIFKMYYVADSSGKVSTFSQCATHGSFPEEWQQTLYNLFTFLCLFIIPLLIMLVCNFKILLTMTQALHQDRHKPALKQSKNNIPQARLKTLKMTVAFATLFMVCWAPYYVLGIWYWFDPELVDRVSEPANHFFFLFGLLNPCIDPLIYGYFSM
ncbi:gonadotropin-releasing hormone receptor [Rhinatrema bivittatum]|uniref:gonadotropin-releasing hormone receptor n=1 Tax=Rhinatrema bivittatum TaxID=194408 RepID=UPI00112E82D3|nr:gonadotropin-releasing hormone receptor [Rhinatrema bivittatum]